MVALKLTCARLHFHVSGAKRPLAANSLSEGNSGWSFFFFRPTPYGFRQVVQHVSKHVANEIN